MSSERKNTGLRVALASYDVHQLRVWHQYIAEQSAEILCSEYRSGEELLQSLKQGRNTEVVVLGGPLEDMDSRDFLERMSRLPQKPLQLPVPPEKAAVSHGKEHQPQCQTQRTGIEHCLQGQVVEGEYRREYADGPRQQQQQLVLAFQVSQQHSQPSTR